MRRASMSATVTWWPRRAKPTAVTRPTWPAPRRKRCMATRTLADVPGLRLGEGRPDDRLDDSVGRAAVRNIEGLSREPSNPLGVERAAAEVLGEPARFGEHRARHERGVVDVEPALGLVLRVIRRKEGHGPAEEGEL